MGSIELKPGRIELKPGIPDDDNRDYLPEKLKESKIVVNENGNNSQPYPENLKEYHGAIVDESEDEWYVYVPDSYDPQKKTPLVFSMHGGLMTGWGQAVYTSWTMMADRDGFLVVFPNASVGRAWQVQWGEWDYDPDREEPLDATPKAQILASPENVEENHDVQLVLRLTEWMKERYNVDEGRIFMQGMSMGNMMTSLFARYFGGMLAGAAGSGCATFLSLLFDENGKIKNQGGPLAVWQSRPERNNIPEDDREALRVNKYNRLYWMRINECGPVPQISIAGENNFAFYKGKKADLVYLDVKNRDHGQTLDDAALIWDYLYSGVSRKEDGTIVCSEPFRPRVGDAFAISFAEGCKNAWFENRVIEMKTKAVLWKKLKYHGLDGGQKVRGEYLCVPVSFLAQAFGAETEYSEEGRHVVMKLADGRKVQFAEGSIGCVTDRELRSMYCEALFRDGELLVPAEWFCRYLFNLHVSVCDGVIYITDHFNELSVYMADLIRDLLKERAVPENYQEML